MRTLQRLHEATTPGLSPRLAMLVDLARQVSDPMPERLRTSGLSKLRSRIGARRGERFGRAVQVTFAAAVCGVLSLTLARRHAPHPSGAFRVEGATVGVGGYVQAGPAEHPVVYFGDGSEVSLEERTRLRVLSLNDHGARLTLDEGRAHVYVVHTPETAWFVEAGPFVVAVTGTAFGISWSGSEQRLDVRLENGSVTVRGPASETMLTLRAGQWLTVRGNEVLLRGLAEPDAGQPPVTTDPSLDDEGAPPRAAVSSAAAESKRSRDRALTRTRRRGDVRPKEHTHHWAAALAAGRFEAIVDDALDIGLESAFSESEAEDLAALGDAARYTRRNDIARSALLSLRRRFPDSEQGRAAAFSLGRLCEADGDDRSALSWFESYVSDVPDGRFASEALGRKMNLVQRHDGKEAARPLAAAYLRRFPDGIYAEAARALTRLP